MSLLFQVGNRDDSNLYINVKLKAAEEVKQAQKNGANAPPQLPPLPFSESCLSPLALLPQKLSSPAADFGLPILQVRNG